MVCVWLLALVLGPIVTELSLSDYLTTPQTWIYPLRSSVLITFAGRLPGVYEHNPFANAVDGSLWTLPLEACCYVMVAVLGVLALLHRRALLAAAVVVGLVALSPPVDIASHLPGGAQDTAAGGNVQIVIHLVVVFLVGSLLFAARERVRLSWWVAAALGVLWVVSWKSSWVTVTASLFVPYAILVIAYRAPRGLNALVRPGDVSYGVYVYAFPVQQTVALAWKGVGPLGMLVDRHPGHLPARSHLVAARRVARARAQEPRGRHLAAATGDLRGRGVRLALPAPMLATTDRPLRLAFVGQATFFEACALDNGAVAALRH